MKRAAQRALAPAYFAGVTLLFAWPMLLGRSTSAVPGFQALVWPWRGVVDTDAAPALQVDGAASSYPWSVTYHYALRRLELPLWDWHSFVGGYDLASDGVAGAMYPVHWVLWGAFSPARAHDVFVVLHLCAGGLVMFHLLRHWRLGTGPALVGGTAWMLAPFNVGWLQAEMIAPVLVVVPLTFWAVSSAITHGTVPRIFGASAAIALALVAGNIVVFLTTVWVVGLWAAATWFFALARREPAAALGRRARTLACIAIGGFALSAYSVVPTVLNLLSLGRRPSRLAEVLPPAADLKSIALTLWHQPDVVTPGALFTLGWSGRVVLVLAVLGLLHRGGKRALGASLVIVFTLLPATPGLVHVGWYIIPTLRAVAGFGRLTFLASFGLVVLAASGTAVVLLVLSRAMDRLRLAAPYRAAVPGVVVATMATLVIWELLPAAVAVNPRWTDASDDPFFPVTDVHRAVEHRPGVWPPLVLPLTAAAPTQPDGVPFYALWASTAHIRGLDSVGGYDSAVPQRATAVSRIMEGTPVPVALEPFSTAYLPAYSLPWARIDLAQRMGVTHIYAPPGADLADSAYAAALPEVRLTHRGADGQVWELEQPTRGPRLVSSAVYVTSPVEAFEQFTAATHDPRRAVVLETPDASAEPLAAAGSTDRSSGRVLRSRRGYDKAQVDVVARRDAWLVVPIGFKEGWRAEVDGRPLTIRPADGAFSAVRVPAGSHTVTFSYRPAGFTLGVAITGLALVGGAGWLLMHTLRARRRRTHDDAGPEPRQRPTRVAQT